MSYVATCPTCGHKVKSGSTAWCDTCKDECIPYYQKAFAEKRAKKGLKRSRLKPVSNKTGALNRLYQKSDPLVAGHECCKCGTHDNLTKHHPYGRSGKFEGKDTILLWIWLCWECHKWVHDSAKDALEQGWLQPKFYNILGQRPKPWMKN